MSDPGYRLGFVPPAEVEAELKVHGTLPDWLGGRLLRTCAGLYETEAGWRARHHFDGLAMLYRFDLENNRVTFRNRFLQSQQYRAALQGERRGNEFAARSPRRLLDIFSHPLPRMSDNTNINICNVAGRFLALNESIYQYAFDPATLETMGRHYYDDDLPSTMAMTAHPLYDYEKQELVNIGIKYRQRSRIYVFKLGAGSNNRKIIAHYDVPHPPWIHSFCMTRRHIVVIHHPFFFDPLRFLLSGRPVADHFDWRPEAGTALAVIDRESGSLHWYETTPFLMIHAANAYENGEELILDVLAYPDPEVLISVLSLPLNTHPPVPDVIDRPSYDMSKLLRLRIHPSSRAVHDEQLFEEEFEFPRINETMVRGRPHRFVYGIGPDRQHADGYMSRLYKFDVERRTVRSWGEPGRYLSEPVFVGRPGSEREDDGVLLVPTLIGTRGISTLAVIDARNLVEVARADVPVHLPFGFHGQFFPFRAAG